MTGRGLACLCYLGHLNLSLEDPKSQEQASHYFSMALKLAAQVRSVPLALDVLLGWAIFLSRSGYKRGAMAILTLVLDHPGSDQETKNRAAEYQTELAADFSPETEATALAQNPGRDLWETIAKLLKEVSTSGATTSDAQT